MEKVVFEKFELDRIIYEVRPAVSCHGCSFFIDDENECLDYHYRCGFCAASSRTDGQDVIFVQVGESLD